MNITSRIEMLPAKIFVGMRRTMSFSQNSTAELWRSFMPLRKNLRSVGDELYSIEIYPPSFFQHFNPDAGFEKWAALELEDSQYAPEDLEKLESPGGLYAIFLYKGAANAATPFYQYIFNTWLPEHGYTVDERPHFAVMGAQYKQDHPESEEELWIPVKILDSII